MRKDINVTDGTVLETLNNKVDIDGGNYPGSGLEEYISMSQKRRITNCLLEVPQRIKLELVDGVLTLKAGSEVIVPNGFEEDGVTPKFDYVSVESDISTEGTSWGGGDCFLIYNSTLNKFGIRDIDQCVSGNNTPTDTSIGIWYDTANNIVKQVDGTWIGSYLALPLGVIKVQTSLPYITSIDQVFNGMGYIGSTVWVDKGVKGLVSNGKNEDDSLKNVERLFPNIITRTWSDGAAIGTLVSTSDTYMDVTTPSYWRYDEQRNMWIHATSGSQGMLLPLADITLTAGKITSFNPKQAFRAIDYSDKPEISSWGMPGSKTASFSAGASGAHYTAPANGYFVFGGKASSSSVAYFNANISETGLQVQSWIPPNFQGNTVRGFLPCKKGQRLNLSYYSMTIDVLFFRYAEGDE